VGAVLQDGLREIAASHEQVTDVRGKGLMIGLELRSHEEADALVQAAFERGLLLLTAGSRAVRISPPLVLDSEDAATGLEIIASALGDLPA
jgi:4-aminobutyrate aminotransferase-like enzyme